MKKVFIQDDSSHWYLIPVDKKEEFSKWIEDIYEEDIYSVNFNDYLIDGCPSMYSVENVEEL